MEPDSDPTVSGRHMLGPHVVGRRVVIRRVVRGETGPTGGPALTDVLGVCEAWPAERGGTVVVRREDGSTVGISTSDIVSGKPVPPRPSRFSRLTDEEVERRLAGIFRPGVVEQYGAWPFRFTGGDRGRPNSILALGDPGTDLAGLLSAADRFYTAHGRRPLAQVVDGSTAERLLLEAGWVDRDPGGSGVDVLLAGVAALSRQLRARATGSVEGDVTTRQMGAPGEVRHADRFSREWLAGSGRTDADLEVVERLLDLDRTTFASLDDEHGQVARGRITLVDDWALLGDLVVRPDRRREGFANVVLEELVGWSAEHGASVMALQVQADNAPAQRLYEALGFERHHGYHYLVPPPPASA